MSWQPVQVFAGVGDDGSPRCEGGWDSARWRQRLATSDKVEGHGWAFRR
jgi:hypothetical protein